MRIEPPPCDAHPAEAAGWTCPPCDRHLCPACAVLRPVGHGHLVVCHACGSVAEPILLPRAREGYLALVGGALSYPLSRRGLGMMLISGTVFGLLKALGPLAALVAAATFSSYLFVVVRTSARGEPDVPEGDDFTHLWDLFGALFRVVLAFVLALVPAYVYVTRVRSPADTLAGYLPDPLVWVCLAVGLAWVPMAMLLAAVGATTITVVNPLAAFGLLSSLRRDAVVASLAFWGFIGGWVAVLWLGLQLQAAVPVPLVPRVIAEIFGMYFPLVAARSLGLLLFARGADLDYGRPGDHLEPALRGVVPALERAPIELPPDDGAPTAFQEGFSSGLELGTFDGVARFPMDHELDLGFLPEGEAPRERLRPAAAQTVGEDLMPEEAFYADVVNRAPAAPQKAIAQVAQAIDTTDAGIRLLASHSRFDAVARAYRERQGAVDVLSAVELYGTADAALRLEDAKTAAHALKRLGRDHPESEHAPMALWRAAKLMRESLADPDGAAKLLARLVRTYPESEAAAMAQALLLEQVTG